MYSLYDSPAWASLEKQCLFLWLIFFMMKIMINGSSCYIKHIFPLWCSKTQRCRRQNMRLRTNGPLRGHVEPLLCRRPGFLSTYCPFHSLRSAWNTIHWWIKLPPETDRSFQVAMWKDIFSFYDSELLNPKHSKLPWIIVHEPLLNLIIFASWFIEQE